MKKVKQQKNEEGRDINRDLLEIEKCVFGSENDNYLVTKFECQSDETISPPAILGPSPARKEGTGAPPKPGRS
jgi:hypothetical protein